MEYSAKIIGDQRVALRFDEFPKMAHDGLARKIAELTENLASAVEERVPRGTTGRVAGAIKSGVEIQTDKIRGWVSLAGSDPALVRQIMALEFGSRGQKFAVRSYTRTLDQVFGRMTAPFDQVVAAYRRAGGLAELDFLHGPLKAQGDAAVTAMKEIVDQAIRESDK